MTELYLNSKFMGTVDDSNSFVKRIKEERRMGNLTYNLNVRYDEKADEIYIETSKGRSRRPLIIVSEGQPLLTENHLKQLEKNEISWSDMVKQGIIEYLDAEKRKMRLWHFLKKI